MDFADFRQQPARVATPGLGRPRAAAGSPAAEPRTAADPGAHRRRGRGSPFSLPSSEMPRARKGAPGLPVDPSSRRGGRG